MFMGDALIFQYLYTKSGVVAYTKNSGVWKAETEGSRSEANLGYIVRSCLTIKQQTKYKLLSFQ